MCVSVRGFAEWLVASEIGWRSTDGRICMACVHPRPCLRALACVRTYVRACVRQVWSKETTLAVAHRPFPKTKTVSFVHTRDIELALRYVDDEAAGSRLPAGTQEGIARYSITGIADAAQDEQYSYVAVCVCVCACGLLLGAAWTRLTRPKSLANTSIVVVVGTIDTPPLCVV